MLAEFNEVVQGSQSLKDQGKSRTRIEMNAQIRKVAIP